MALSLTGIVGQPASPVSGDQKLRLDPLQAGVTTNLNGKYYEAARNGLVFTSGTLVGGVAMVSYGSTAAAFVLYNPSTSNRKLHVIKTKVGYVSGTQTPGFFCYSISSANQAVPTGTAAVVANNLIGGVASTATPLYSATVTAMTYFEPMGVSVNALTASAIVTPWSCVDDVDGRIVLTPGSWLNLAGSVAAFGTYAVSMTWIELPTTA